MKGLITKDIALRSVDDYLDALPVKERMALERIRGVVKSVAPQAEEKISYGMPSYRLNGMLVGFAAFKNHCAFYALNKTLVQTFKSELKTYETAMGTIRFDVNRPIPVPLLRKLVKYRVAENEAKAGMKILTKKKR